MLVVNPLWGSSTAEPGLTTSSFLSKATMHWPSIPSMTNLILSPSSILRSRRDLTLLSDFHDCAGSVTGHLLLVPPMHLPKENTIHRGGYYGGGAELPAINIAAATALVLNGPGKSSPHIGL